MKSVRDRPKWQTFLTAIQFSAAAYAVWREHNRHAVTNAALAPNAALHEHHHGSTPVTVPSAAGAQRVAATAATAPHASYLMSLARTAIAAAKAWSTHRAASKGAALALYTLFSLAPMLVLVVAMAGFFYGEDNVRRLLLEQMQGLIGAQGAEAIKAVLAPQPKNTSLMAGIVSAALVLVSATSAFAELKDSLDELWGNPKRDTSGIWGLIQERFLSFGLLLVLTLMLLASLVVSAALAALGSLWGSGAESALQVISQFISNTVSFLIVTVIFAVIFKYLPATRIAWNDVLVGALVTAALFTAGKTAIGLYVAHGSIGSAYGAAGSVVVLITWIYYSSQIFFYGALFTHVYAMQIGSRSHTARQKAAAGGNDARI